MGEPEKLIDGRDKSVSRASIKFARRGKKGRTSKLEITRVCELIIFRSKVNFDGLFLIRLDDDGFDYLDNT